ncbi:unnamed protein product, partial [Oppiella nova]
MASTLAHKNGITSANDKSTTGGGDDWKAQLKAPPKDTRVQTTDV